MDELVVFPDAELLTIDAIAADFATSFTGVNGGTRVPNPRPDEFFTVTRFGGPRTTRITENAFLTVEVWAQLETRAVAMMNRIRAVLFSLEGELFGVTEIGGPINLPDPTTSQIRYTQNFGVRTRGAVSA